MQVKIETKYFTDGKTILKLKNYRNVWIKRVDYTKDSCQYVGWEIDDNVGCVLEATPGEAYSVYESHFMFLWDTYAKETDERLTKHAQERKQWLLSVVEEEISNV